MKQKYGLLAIVALSSSVLFSACMKTDYYTPPATPVGYQHSFDDEFDYDTHNWSFTDNYNNAYVTVANGLLKYSYHPTGSGSNSVAVATGINFQRDFLIQTRIESNNTMGLVFGVSDNVYGYSFLIDDRGYFAVYDEGDANTQSRALLTWQNSSAIKQGWNDLEIEQINGTWNGYINGTRVFQIAGQPIGGYKTGFLVLDGTTGYADYLIEQW